MSLWFCNVLHITMGHGISPWEYCFWHVLADLPCCLEGPKQTKITKSQKALALSGSFRTSQFNFPDILKQSKEPLGKTDLELRNLQLCTKKRLNMSHPEPVCRDTVYSVRRIQWLFVVGCVYSLQVRFPGKNERFWSGSVKSRWNLKGVPRMTWQPDISSFEFYC